MSGSFEVIPFNNHQILTLRQPDGVFVVMKPIVEALGLTWRKQHERITKHPVISKGVTFKVIPSAGGLQEMLTLDLEQFHGWLVTLDPRRVLNEEVRANIVLYQQQAFRVIFEHHHGKMNAPRITGKGAAAQIALNNHYLALGNKLLLTKDPAARQMIYGVLQRIGEQIGQEPPALEDMGKENPPVPHVLDRFFTLVKQLEKAGHPVNHSRVPGMLAIRLAEIRELFSQEGISFELEGRAFTSALKLSTSPKFIKRGAVNPDPKRGDKTIHAWLFRYDD